jgi:hypothetical protein
VAIILAGMLLHPTAEVLFSQVTRVTDPLNCFGVTSESNSYSPQFVQISKVAYFFLATCCEEC